MAPLQAEFNSFLCGGQWFLLRSCVWPCWAV